MKQNPHFSILNTSLVMVQIPVIGKSFWLFNKSLHSNTRESRKHFFKTSEGRYGGVSLISV